MPVTELIPMARHDRSARAGAERTNLYDDITNKIIAELEEGRVPWVQPWGTAAAKAPLAMPKNAATGRGYSGINVLILWGAVIQHGFPGQSWLTFRQALSLGGNVRKSQRWQRGGGDIEPRSLLCPDQPFGCEPVIGFDDRGGRNAHRLGEGPDRWQPVAGTERATSDFGTDHFHDLNGSRPPATDGLLHDAQVYGLLYQYGLFLLY